jgi:hypothetical protein
MWILFSSWELFPTSDMTTDEKAAALARLVLLLSLFLKLLWWQRSYGLRFLLIGIAAVFLVWLGLDGQ